MREVDLETILTLESKPKGDIKSDFQELKHLLEKQLMTWWDIILHERGGDYAQES